MRSNLNKSASFPDGLWVISNGKYTDLDLKGICKETRVGSVREYRISDLAMYMLKPNPIEIETRLVGCEVRWHQPYSNKLRKMIRELLPRKLHKTIKDRDNPPEILMSDFETKIPLMKDENLELHLGKVRDLLRQYDSLSEKLSRLDIAKISDLIAIGEDIDGNRSRFALRDGIDEKISYMGNLILNNVRVILDKAYVADGLFEMRGFDFESYDPNNSYRAIKFSQNDKTVFCVLGSDNKVEYWIDDIRLVHYMHLLEQAIRTDHKLYDSLKLCMKGDARPFRMLFNKQLKIDYSKTYLPRLYEDLFMAHNMGSDEKSAVMSSLKNQQFGISFNYVPQFDSGEEKMVTSISVMHNFRALEPIEENLPRLYSEIDKKTSVSEAGKFYLLDSIRGCRNG